MAVTAAVTNDIADVIIATITSVVWSAILL
jgi:hypothetical protein